MARLGIWVTVTRCIQHRSAKDAFIPAHSLHTAVHTVFCRSEFPHAGLSEPPRTWRLSGLSESKHYSLVNLGVAIAS